MRSSLRVLVPGGNARPKGEKIQVAQRCRVVSTSPASPSCGPLDYLLVAPPPGLFKGLGLAGWLASISLGAKPHSRCCMKRELAIKSSIADATEDATKLLRRVLWTTSINFLGSNPPSYFQNYAHRMRLSCTTCQTRATPSQELPSLRQSNPIPPHSAPFRPSPTTYLAPRLNPPPYPPAAPTSDAFQVDVAPGDLARRARPGVWW